jgi:hypothetical protein
MAAISDENAQRSTPNEARGTRDIEGKATRVGASELGNERVSTLNVQLSNRYAPILLIAIGRRNSVDRFQA